MIDSKCFGKISNMYMRIRSYTNPGAKERPMGSAGKAPLTSTEVKEEQRAGRARTMATEARGALRPGPFFQTGDDFEAISGPQYFFLTSGRPFFLYLFMLQLFNIHAYVFGVFFFTDPYQCSPGEVGMVCSSTGPLFSPPHDRIGDWAVKVPACGSQRHVRWLRRLE